MVMTDFVKGEMLKVERRLFFARLLATAVGYTVVTLILNAIRANAPLWLVWVLIVLQFGLYFLIFIISYNRAKVFGLPSYGFVLFLILCVLGRVNDWEMIILPLLVITMFVLAFRNKKVSEHGQAIFNKQ